MDTIEGITRELSERLREAQQKAQSDDWLRRLITQPPRPLARKRLRFSLTHAVRAAGASLRR